MPEREIGCHRLRIEGGAVMEGDALLQIKGQVLALIGELLPFRQAGDNLAVHIVDKALVAQLGCDIVLRVHVQRVKSVQLGPHSSGERLDGFFLGRTAGGGIGGGAAGRRRIISAAARQGPAE